MERIGGEIERELARAGSSKGVPLAALTAAWPEVVGDADRPAGVAASGQP